MKESRAVYLIGGGYSHKRNQSHSAVALRSYKDPKLGEIRSSTSELTKIAEYENKMKNRVNYLEKEEKRMQQKMSVIQKRVDVRENAIRAK